MTAVSDIITAAFRVSNVISRFATPDAMQQAEALSILNPILLGVIGNEVGQELRDYNVGGLYDRSAALTDYIPPDARIVLSDPGADKTWNLHPQPYEGQRVAVVDGSDALSTYTVTLDGNGHLIAGAASLTLSQPSDAGQWFYRADTAQWTQATELAVGDTMPFPQEFDRYFITRMAMELNPQYGSALGAQSAAALQDTANRLAARYRRPNIPNDPGGLGTSGRPLRYGVSTAALDRGGFW